MTTSISALALAGAALVAQSAELGDIAPRSYIGQPLAVDIDLVALTPEELAGLQVRLADANVYRGANVTMNPALASVRLQVEKRGSRQVLHVTTTRAVDAEYVHLYVELGVPGKQDVRLATVWLQKDPTPPAPVVVAPPASVMTPAQAEQIAAQARAARVASEAASRQAAAEAASRAATEAASKAAADAASRQAAVTAAAAAELVRERSKPAPLPSAHEADGVAAGEGKPAGKPRRIAGVWVSADGKPMKSPPKEEAAEVPVGVAQALLPLAPLPLPKGVKRPAPVSCAPTGMSARECQALDNHNAELSSKLVELEGKMKMLQGALAGTAPAAVSVAAQPGKAAHGAAVAAPAAAAAAGAAGAAGAASAPAAHSASSAPASSSAAAAASGGASAGAARGEAAAASASASMAAQGETEAHAAKAASAGAEASASASAAASVLTGPVKQVRVLPKLKYKKEKPVEQPTDYTLPLAAGGVGLLALLGAGFFWWRKKTSGSGPLKIWQGFRKKTAPEAAAEPVAEAAPESVA